MLRVFLSLNCVLLLVAADVDEVLRCLTGSTEFYWVLLGFTGFNWVLLGFTGFHRLLLGLSEFYLVLLALPSSTGFLIRLAWFLLWFNEVLLGFDEVNLVLPKFAGVLLRFTVFLFCAKNETMHWRRSMWPLYRILLGFTEYDSVLLGFTGFYSVLPGFT